MGGRPLPSEAHDARMSLAVALANAPTLDDNAKVSLLKSLNLESYIGPDQITDKAGSTIPALVDADLMADDEAAFARLAQGEWKVKERLIDASREFVNCLPRVELSSAVITVIAKARRTPSRSRTVSRSGEAPDGQFVTAGQRNDDHRNRILLRNPATHAINHGQRKGCGWQRRCAVGRQRRRRVLGRARPRARRSSPAS